MYLLSRRSILRWALLILAAIAPAYCVARTTGLWSGAQLVDMAASNVDVERAESLNFRLVQENELISKALERPAFGWGGWGRNRVTNKVGRDQSVTDGMWVIFLGTSGIVGLTAFGAMVLLPIVRYSQTVSSTLMAKPQSMGSTGCAVVLCLWCVDSLFNAALLPPYLVMAAGLTGITMPRLERDRPSG